MYDFKQIFKFQQIYSSAIDFNTVLFLMFTSQICFKFESSEWRIQTLDNRDCCCCCCCSFPLSRPSVGSNSKRSGAPIFRKDRRWIRDRQVRREELENGPKSGRNIKKLFCLLFRILSSPTLLMKYVNQTLLTCSNFHTDQYL